MKRSLAIIKKKHSYDNVSQFADGMVTQFFKGGDVSTAAGTSNGIASWSQIMKNTCIVEEPSSACLIGSKPLLGGKQCSFSANQRLRSLKSSGKTLILNPKKNKLFIKKATYAYTKRH